MSIFKVGLGSLLIALLTVVAGIQAGKVAAHEVSCEFIGSGFQISVNNGQAAILMIEDSSSINQSCQQIANRLEREINKQSLTSLMLVADSRGWQDAICVVRSARGACRSDGSNLLLNVPEGIDREQFLTGILTIRTDIVRSGSVEDHTNFVSYAKLGEALSFALSR